MSEITMQLLDGGYKICRFSAESPIPHHALVADWFSITRTDDELSIVCADTVKFKCDIAEDGWSMFKLIGPFAFDLTGIVAGISRVIAHADIGIFVISTYDTDYVLIKEKNLVPAMKALRGSGYRVLT